MQRQSGILSLSEIVIRVVDFAIVLCFKILYCALKLITEFMDPLPSLRFVFEGNVSLILHS